ncbi:MAG: flagellar hook-basal body complex protein [Bacteroidales bacterium]|nr:flagellar hook-basal body complex protein [Lachnoclostridium sp.]MCM1385042.1 flagellar hook-basal body complex protein [Lachnoclostridium sp.]MCM1465326.1 flagellar hook-basal body complex protein [Bacteroidales bacterium]
MMRSLFSGVAGLKTHQTRMDVIGNNIANVNTTAFKASNMVFSELMSQTTQKASGANANTGTGGVNARQIGLGVKGGAINVNIDTQGASQSTGNPFDIMITGDNFFVVNNGNGNYFTRDGSFYVDGAGNLAMTSTGYNVMGWQVDEETMSIKKDTVSALRIMNAANLTYPPEATTQAHMSGIIDKNDTDVTSVNGLARNLNFFDALGYSYTARIVFKQNGGLVSGEPAGYSVEVTRLLDSTGQEVDISNLTFGSTTTQAKATSLGFNSNAYRWDDTGKILQDAAGNDIVNITDLVTAGIDSRNEPLTVNGNANGTVQEALDEIAKAYGYEGSTEEFLNLYKEIDGDKVTVKTMLTNLGAATASFTPATATNPGSWSSATVFPTLVSTWKDTTAPGATTTTGEAVTESNTGIEMDGRYYTGDAIWFDGKNGKFSGMGSNGSGRNTATIAFSALGGNFSDIVVDFSEISMYDNKGTSTAQATSGDFEGLGAGRRLGDMIGVSVQQNGEIYASYDNGMTKLLGQIATANFANASGLEKNGDNLYSATQNSGEFDGIGVDITADGGYMSTGQLEMSNVDLSSEFTTMITTQRGFQANSRIITVSDTLLEELTNLKR